MGDWESERAYAQNAYQQQYEQDYQNWVNMLNHWSQQAQQEYGAHMDQQQFDAQQAAQNREYAYNQAMAILAAGKMPTAELLAAAGISAADANSLMAKKSSGSKKSTSSGTQPKPQEQKVTSNDTYDTLVYALSKSTTTSSQEAATDRIYNAYKAGNITEAQANRLLDAIDTSKKNTYVPGSFSSSKKSASVR